MPILRDYETRLFFSMRAALYGNLRARPALARRQRCLRRMEYVSSKILRARSLIKAADALCKSGLLRGHVATRLTEERGDLRKVTNRVLRLLRLLTATSVCNDLAYTLHGVRFFVVTLRFGDYWTNLRRQVNALLDLLSLLL